jgi:hypothetical protein
MLALLAAAALSMAAPVRAPEWQPARTWVVVVGLLTWKDEDSFESFPTENRRDAQLVSYFREHGVPGSQIVYLQDRAATTRAVRSTLTRVLARTRPGDMLFVYYCGHGFEDDDGVPLFATWDAGAGSPGWPMADLPQQIAREFHGAHVLLAADACLSGALVRAARVMSVPYMVLASTTAVETSTENWTFTEALLDGLRGEPWADTDGDGDVDLGEVAREIRDDMAFAEDQQSAHGGTWSPATVLAVSRGVSAPRVGERVQVDSEGDRYPARVIAARNGLLRVRYFGYEVSDDEWVKPSRVHRR